MSRKLLAFKRAPSVEVRFDDLHIEVKQDRVQLYVGADGMVASFGWNEWRDLARRIEHSMQWIDEHTPTDVTGVSFEIDP